MLVNNQRGIALMMVLTSIGILTFLIYNFSFDSFIHKKRAISVQQKTQAKLNAESGLKISLARLEIYKEAFNQLEKNKEGKKVISPEILNMIWSQPLIFPIPVLPGISIKEKSVLEAFEKDSLLQGKISISIDSMSNKINLNLLRASAFLDYLKLNQKVKSKPAGSDVDDPPQGSEEESNETASLDIDKRLADLITVALQAKRETDEAFFQKYSGLDVNELIAAIKFYVSDAGKDIGPLGNQVEGDFSKSNIYVKHAPMSSISELYLLPGWNDDLVNLIKNEVTVHGDAILDINKLTGNLLRLLLPNLTTEQVKEFFNFKNDPKAPAFFNNIQQLKKYFTDEARIIESGYFDERVKLFAQAGITFGTGPVLFKVVSTGDYLGTTYTINAIVSLATEKQTNKKGSDQSGKKDEAITQLSKPVIVEISVN